MSKEYVCTKVGLPTECDGCGKVFVRNSASHKFCEPPCRYKFRKSEMNAYHRDYNSRHPIKMMLKAAKHRALKRGIPFDLVADDITLPEFCPVLGLKLEIHAGRGKGSGGHDNSYSLDRIEPSKGYVKGNVQVISHKANSMKHTATREDLIAFASWVMNTYGEEDE